MVVGRYYGLFGGENWAPSRAGVRMAFATRSLIFRFLSRWKVAGC